MFCLEMRSLRIQSDAGARGSDCRGLASSHFCKVTSHLDPSFTDGYAERRQVDGPGAHSVVS